MAVAYSDGCIRIFDLRTWQMIYAFEAHQHSVFALQYSPDGQQLVSGGRDAHLKIWETSDYTLRQDIAAHIFAINDLVFSPDAQYLATCSMDKSVKLWSAIDFRLLKVIDKARHAGHGTSINKLLWTTFQNKLVSASDDRNLSVWRSNLWD
jgi:WD40 repeat protein